MLFYKVDISNPAVKAKHTYSPEVFIKSEENLDKEQCESFLNEVQLQTNAVLKSVVTFQDSRKWHLIITQPNKQDKLYMVTEWPPSVFSQEGEAEEQIAHIPGLSTRDRFLEKSALWIVQEESAMTNQLCEFIMNSNIDESCLVYSN